MATLVGGIGVSHTPQIEIPPEGWLAHGATYDAKTIPKAGLEPSRRSPDDLVAELESSVMAGRHAACQDALTKVTQALKAMAPDILVIVGDDQREIFLDDGMPAVAVFWGDRLYDRPPGDGAYPVSMKAAYRYYHGEHEESYPTSSALGLHVIKQLIDDSFDVAQFSVQPEGRSLGHAFTFIRRRVIPGETIPIVPIMLNTYFPPNQPHPARCVALGQALSRAIRSWPENRRVAVVASGGLTHPIIDEDLDRALLAALIDHDTGVLAKLPVASLVEGSSEIRNWITAGAALNDCDAAIVDYVPAYRSALGSGCGMGFMVWTSEAGR
jgi:Catalytic LigB subunit of aromatic ring-opening dioxygenase